MARVAQGIGAAQFIRRLYVQLPECLLEGLADFLIEQQTLPNMPSPRLEQVEGVGNLDGYAGPPGQRIALRVLQSFLTGQAETFA